MHAGRTDGPDASAGHSGDDHRRTRLCDLPWKNFVVDTTTDTPLAAPCRNHPYEWNARDFEHTASELGSLRRNLLHGDLSSVCRSCPDKAWSSTTELRALIEAEKLDDTKQLKTAGIVDSRLDATLDGLAPAGYYRTTFQSRAFTERLWGRRFEVAEYIDAGIFNYQDLIVLKKRKGAGVRRTLWWRHLIRGN